MKTLPSDAPKARVASIRTTTRSKAFMVGTTGTTRSQPGADDDSRHVTTTGGQWTGDSEATADRAKATARAYRQWRHRGLDTVPAAREAAVVLNGWQLLHLRPGGWKGGRLVLGKLAAHCLFSSSPSHRLAPALNTALSSHSRGWGVGWGEGGDRRMGAGFDEHVSLLRHCPALPERVSLCLDVGKAFRRGAWPRVSEWPRCFTA